MSLRPYIASPTCLSRRLAPGTVQSPFLQLYDTTFLPSSCRALNRSAQQLFRRDDTSKAKLPQWPSKNAKTAIYPPNSLGVWTRANVRNKDDGTTASTPSTVHLAPSLGKRSEQVSSVILGNQDAFDSWTIEWQQAYNDLVAAHKHKPHLLQTLFAQEYHLAKAFTQDLDAQLFELEWGSLDVNDRIRWTRPVLIGSLVTSAKQSMFVLENMPIVAWDWRIRMQCLIFMQSVYHETELRFDNEIQQKFRNQVQYLQNPALWPRKAMTSLLFRRLMQWSSPSECQALMSALEDKYPYSPADTTCSIIDYYARTQQVENAMQCLQSLPKRMLKDPPPVLKIARDTLIKNDSITRRESGANFTILPQLLHLGMQPDASLYNAVLESAISNGYPDVAWDLYHHLVDQNFQVNARSHLVLLKDAFARHNTRDIDQIMTAVHGRKDLILDPHLIAVSMNVIRVASSQERNSNPKEALTHVLALYDRAWTRAPLLRLGIVRALNTLDQFSLPHPPPSSLAFTIWTFVLLQRQALVVDDLWKCITDLIAGGDEQIIAAAKYDFIYNALIRFYSREPRTLGRGVKIMQYMLQHGLCTPSSRTWGILICAFLKHGQMEPAQRILSTMQLHGVQLEELDENLLPKPYTLQDLQNRVDAILDEREIPKAFTEIRVDSEETALNDAIS